MALRAFDQCVRRKLLGLENAQMAGAAFIGSPRRIGGMGIMASNAPFHRIMRHRVDLRETGGARRIVFMADQTLFPFAGNNRLHLAGTVDVFLSGPMAGFAIHRTVIGFRFLRRHIVMAIAASLMPGVFDFLPDNIVHRRSPVMSDIAESLWHQQPSSYQE